MRYHFYRRRLGRAQAACDQYPLQQGVRCPVGQACITNSFKLKSRGIKAIIHAVGPDCRRIKNPVQQDQLLESAYLSALRLADQAQLTSIAFPLLSAAIYAFPKARAATIALQTIRAYARHSHSDLSEIHLVLFSAADFELCCQLASQQP